MSYILDALNKSELERRQRHSTPDWQASPVVPSQSARSRWLVPGLALTAVAALLCGYYLAKSTLSTNPSPLAPSASQLQISPTQQIRPESALVNPAKPIRAEAATPSSDIAQHSSVESTPLPEISTATSSVEFTPAPAELPTAMAEQSPTGDAINAHPAISTKETFPHITDLPQSIRSQIPDLVYSAHVYSDNGGTGFVILNGSMRYPNYHVTGDIILKEILADGVVLDYRGTRFRLTAMKSWSTP